MRQYHLLPLAFSLFLVLTCVKSPTDPYTQGKADVNLVLRSSWSEESDTTVTDTVGNKIRIGLCLYLMNYIDSATVVVAQSLSSIDTAATFILKQKDTMTDTIWFNKIFTEPGNRTVTATGYVGKSLRPTATATIRVLGRPIPNRPPKFSLDTVKLTGHPGSPVTLTLVDRCSDPDGDTLTFTLMPGAPEQDTATADGYSFTPGPDETGVFYPQVIATDPAGASDTLTIALTISALDLDPPLMRLLTPAKDSTTVSTSSYPVRISCKDPSGVALVKCSMGADTFPVTRSDTTFSANVTGLPSGLFGTISFIAADSSPQANTCTLYVHIKYDPEIADNVPPVITLITPSKDTVIGQDSCRIQMTCTDASRIASVVCALGTQTFSSTKSATADSIYTATIKGFTAGVYSTVTITATDASTAQNNAFAVVRIKYDNDRTPPTITRFDPTKDSTSVNANSYAVKVTCKDASGVASVVFSRGTATFPGVKGAGDTLWSANVTGLVSGSLNKITAVATDSSIHANKDSLTLFIKYDPTMTDSTGPVIFQKSGPATGTIVTTPIITIVDSIYDPSGVDSVYWTQNGKNPNPMTIVSGSIYLYSLSDTLYRDHLDTITINAQDKSTNKNKSSQTIILNYIIPPTITTQPMSQSACVGMSPIFSISASGTSPLTYQWRKGISNFTNITTAKSPACTLSIISAADNGTILSCLVGNGTGSALASTPCTLTVESPSTPPSNATAKTPAICVGSFDTLIVNGGVLGTNASWKWYTDSLCTPTTAATGVYSTDRTQLTVSPISTTTYYIRAEGTCGNTSVASIKVIVYAPPVAADSISATKTIINPGDTSILKINGGSLGSSPGMAWKWYSGGCGGTVVGSTFEGTGESLMVSPTATKSYYVRAEGGTCGITTCAIKKINVLAWTAVNTGLSASSFVKAFLVSGNNIFVATGTDSGVYLTTNNGGNWTAVNNDLPSGTGLASLAMCGTTILAGTYGTGIYRSTNNGSTWSTAYNGLPSGCSVYSIAVSGNTIYAGTNTNGVYYSVDNGDTWTAINTGLLSTNILTLAAQSDTVFSGPTNSIIYRTINKGANWTSASAGISGGDAYAFAFNGNKIFAGIENAGVYLSINNGGSWIPVSNGLPDNSFITSFAIYDKVLFAGIDGVGVFFTQNDGNNWSKVSYGFPSSIRVQSLTISGSFLFAGTDQGVYRTPLSLP